jgi:2-dehydro-3-deoxyphosphogluconate aldolase / (4S)-4-hydroxy-2-oxoglutarate aldolase
MRIDPEVLSKVVGRRLIPVVVIDDVRSCAPLGEALVAGGLAVAEVTLRTPVALDAIRALAAMPGMVVGVGTVISEDQVDAAMAAGASFVVTPGLSASVVRRCQAWGVPVLPGVVTPTDVIAALELGIEMLKFFPAEASGGLPMIKALAGPFPKVTFVPTGGIAASNARSYLDLPNVAAVGGSWMLPADLIESGDVAGLTRKVHEAVGLTSHGCAP